MAKKKKGIILGVLGGLAAILATIGLIKSKKKAK